MKSVLLALLVSALGVVAHAVPYTYTLTGVTDLQVTGTTPFALGESFTAQFRVDTATPDSAPSDSTLGRYFYTSGAQINFSGGFSLTNAAFEYRVVDSGFSPVVNQTLDALIFNLVQPTYSLAFSLRFTPDTFTNDSALTPIVTPLTPHPIGFLVPAEMIYTAGNGSANGSITATTVRASAVPEAGATAGLLLLPLIGLIALQVSRRQSQSQTLHS